MRLWLYFFLLFFQYLKACEYKFANDVASAANFVFFFDSAFSETQMKRWKKLTKTMACELPVHEKIKVATALKHDQKISISNWKESTNFTDELDSITSFESNLECPSFTTIVDKLGEINYETHLILPIDSQLNCDFEEAKVNLINISELIIFDRIGLGSDKGNKSEVIFNVAWSDIDHLESDEDFGTVLGSFSVKVQEAHTIHNKMKAWANSLPKAVDTNVTVLWNTSTISMETSTIDIKVSTFINESEQVDIVTGPLNTTLDVSNEETTTPTTSEVLENLPVTEYFAKNITVIPTSLENSPSTSIENITLNANETFVSVSPIDKDELLSTNNTTSWNLTSFDETTLQPDEVSNTTESLNESATNGTNVNESSDNTSSRNMTFENDVNLQNEESLDESVSNSTIEETSDIGLKNNNSTEETTIVQIGTKDVTANSLIEIELGNTTLSEDETGTKRITTDALVSTTLTGNSSELTNKTVIVTERGIEYSTVLDSQNTTLSLDNYENNTETEDWKWIKNTTEDDVDVVMAIYENQKNVSEMEEFRQKVENITTSEEPEMENRTIANGTGDSLAAVKGTTGDVIKRNSTSRFNDYGNLTEDVMIMKEDLEVQNNGTSSEQETKNFTTRKPITSGTILQFNETTNGMTNLTGVYSQEMIYDDEETTEKVIEISPSSRFNEYENLTQAVVFMKEDLEPQNNEATAVKQEKENYTSRQPVNSDFILQSNENINGTANLTGVYGEVKTSDEEETTEDPTDKPWHVLFGERLVNHWIVLVVAAVCILLLIGILIMFFIAGRRGAKKKKDKDEEYLGSDLYTAREPSSTSFTEDSGETDRLLADKKEGVNQRIFDGLAPPTARNRLNDDSSKRRRTLAQPIPHPAEGAVDPYSPIFPSHIEERFSDLAVTPLKTTSSAFSRRLTAPPKTTTNPRTVMAMDINDL